jgi:hypothetical protein
MITAFERRAMLLEEPFDIDLTWDRSRAYTVDQATFMRLFERGRVNEEDHEEGSRYLIIDSFCELEAYDRISELAAVTRPRILLILNIICFVTGKAFTTFGFHHSFSTVADNPEAEKQVFAPRLLVEEEDLTAELTELLHAMQQLEAGKRTLVYSLLDRWRKASYLEDESTDSFLYEDETILACFHIFELLANEYGGLIDSDSDQKIQVFTADLLENVYFIRNSQSQAELAKLIGSTISAYKTVKPRILRMMQELGLLERKSQALIERFLNHRNAIAHGRVNLYEDKAIYPLKPFFTHVKDIYEDTESIRIASARAIAAYLGISLWHQEWEDLLESEPPTYEQVQEFNRQRAYEGLSWEQLETGTAEGINVGVLVHYYRKGTLKLSPLMLALKAYILSVELREDNASLVLYAAAILADSPDEAIAVRARELLTQLKDSELRERFDMRDVLKELAYQGKEPQWLKTFLIERAQKS